MNYAVWTTYGSRPARQAAQSIGVPPGGMLYSPVASSRPYRKQGAGGGPVGTQMYGGGPIDAPVRATIKCASASEIELGRLKPFGTASLLLAIFPSYLGL